MSNRNESLHRESFQAGYNISRRTGRIDDRREFLESENKYKSRIAGEKAGVKAYKQDIINEERDRYNKDKGLGKYAPKPEKKSRENKSSSYDDYSSDWASPPTFFSYNLNSITESILPNDLVKLSKSINNNLCCQEYISLIKEFVKINGNKKGIILMLDQAKYIDEIEYCINYFMLSGIDLYSLNGCRMNSLMVSLRYQDAVLASKFTIKFIGMGISYDYPDDNNVTALMVASGRGMSEVVDIFIKQGRISLSDLDKAGHNALSHAVYAEKYDIALKLISIMDIESCKIALSIIITKKWAGGLDALMSKGLVEARNPRFKLALERKDYDYFVDNIERLQCKKDYDYFIFLAVQEDNLDLCKILLSTKADFDLSPLLLETTSLEVLNILLENGADPNYFRFISDKKTPITPLIQFIKLDKYNFINELLAYGAEVKVSSDHNLYEIYSIINPINAANEIGNKDVINLLMNSNKIKRIPPKTREFLDNNQSHNPEDPYDQNGDSLLIYMAVIIGLCLGLGIIYYLEHLK